MCTISDDLLNASVKPLLIRHKVKNDYFIYDAPTNLIFQVDKIIYDILKYYKTIPDEAILKKFKNKYPLNELEKSLAIIKKQEKKYSVLSLDRPKAMCFEENEKKFWGKYKNSLQQLILNVTHNCNLRCKYCVYSGLYRGQRTHSNKQMSWETAKKAVDWYLAHSKKADSRAITFYGGESLLEFPLIKKVIDYVKNIKKEKCVNFSFTTNGTLLKSGKIIDFMIKNDVALLISLDGPEKIHNRYRVFADGRGTFKTVINNLAKIYEKDKEYYEKKVKCTVTLAPPYDIIGVYNFFKSEHYPPLKLSRLSSVDQTDTDFFKIYGTKKDYYRKHTRILFKRYCDFLTNPEDPKNKKENKEILDALYLNKFSNIHRRCTHKHRTMSLNGCCVPGQRRVFTDTNGKLYVCEKVGAFYPLGDVNKGFDFKLIKNFINEYIDLSFKDCKECVVHRFCTMCFKLAMKERKMTLERKRRICAITRRNIIRNIKDYMGIRYKNPKAFDFLKDITFT